MLLITDAFAEMGRCRLEIVKRSDAAKTFEVLPRRWVVERTFAWMGRNRRLAKHFECLAVTALAYLKLAMIQLMLRRLAPSSNAMRTWELAPFDTMHIRNPFT